MFLEYSQPPLRDERVLVVEDNPIIAFDIADILRVAGALVVGPFVRLEPAISAVHAERVSVGVLDVRIGEVTVFPVARALHARSIPFLFYTGHEYEGTLKTNWPGCRVLSKPVRAEALVVTVVELIAAPSQG
ncbi:MAG TPA: response regulator [Hyphomicrobiales bacterium]|nr:response regulator [Hyphomicrobiales bacterium]